jgi:hypothetical protein
MNLEAATVEEAPLMMEIHIQPTFMLAISTPQ